jgi:hypothetical protein
MLSECGQNKDYIRAVNSKGESYSAESLFMLSIAAGYPGCNCRRLGFIWGVQYNI